jgi:YD repeat-containing protein
LRQSRSLLLFANRRNMINRQSGGFNLSQDGTRERNSNARRDHHLGLQRVRRRRVGYRPVGYTIDADGRITAAFSNTSSANNSSVYVYDDESRLTGQNLSYGAYGVTVDLAQTFDANGNRLTLAATVDGPADLLDTFGYNNLNELDNESQQGQPGGDSVSQEAVSFGYDPAGNMTTEDRYGNVAETTAGFTTTNIYDDEERLTASNNSGGGGGSFAYGYNADDWMTSETSNQGTLALSYDDDGRETAATPVGYSSFASEAYTYDNAGNRTSATTGVTHVSSIGIAADNRITSDAGGTYLYDADGNRTQLNVSGGAKVFYTYNAADQMTGVTQNSSGGSPTQTSVYTYDPVTGQRLTLADSGTISQTQLFVYDPTTGNSLLVLNATGAVTERDLPGQKLNQVLAFETGMTGSGSGTVYWMVANNTGTVFNTENLAGTLQTQTVYSSCTCLACPPGSRDSTS